VTPDTSNGYVIGAKDVVEVILPDLCKRDLDQDSGHVNRYWIALTPRE
jgi:hypothetical protein